MTRTISSDFYKSIILQQFKENAEAIIIWKLRGNHQFCGYSLNLLIVEQKKDVWPR